VKISLENKSGENPEGESKDMQAIMAMEQQMMQGGNVDSEKDFFRNLWKGIKDKTITPGQARIKAEEYLSSRQE
jgi:hypothetical protein